MYVHDMNVNPLCKDDFSSMQGQRRAYVYTSAFALSVLLVGKRDASIKCLGCMCAWVCGCECLGICLVCACGCLGVRACVWGWGGVCSSVCLSMCVSVCGCLCPPPLDWSSPNLPSMHVLVTTLVVIDTIAFALAAVALAAVALAAVALAAVALAPVALAAVALAPVALAAVAVEVMATIYDLCKVAQSTRFVKSMRFVQPTDFAQFTH